MTKTKVAPFYLGHSDIKHSECTADVINWNSNAANCDEHNRTVAVYTAQQEKVNQNNMYNNAGITEIHYSTTQMGLALPMYSDC